MIHSALPLGLAALLLATGIAAGADDISGFPGIDQLPEGYQQVDDFQSGAGIPYVKGRPPELPATTYWVDRGKIIGFDVVIDDKQMKAGIDLKGIRPIAGLPSIDHMTLDFDFAHGPFPFATWVLRVDFVSEKYLEQMTGRE